MYAERFWKKNWDDGLEDLDPGQFDTTFVEMIKKPFEQVPDKTALGFLGVDISFRQLDQYANQFANMLQANCSKKSLPAN